MSNNSDPFFVDIKNDVIAEILAVTPQEYREPLIEDQISYEFLDQLMNVRERQIYTVIIRYFEKIKEKRDIISDGNILIRDAKKIQDEILIMEEKRFMLKNLLWLSIQSRLNIWGKHLGVYPGFRIGIPEEESCSCPLCAGDSVSTFAEIISEIKRKLMN